MKFHSGKWWDVLLAYPACTPIHKGVHKGGAAEGPPFLEAAEAASPYGWVSRLGRQGGNLTISHRGYFPPWNIISHLGISNPTVEYRIPPWHAHMLMTTRNPLNNYGMQVVCHLICERSVG